MNTRLFIPLLLGGAVALACGSRSHADADTPRGMHVAATTPSVTPSRRAQVTADVSINPAFVVTATRQELHFDLAITNDGKKHVELVFPSGQEYDFSVVDGRGKEVYRWGSGRMFTQSRQNRMLDGGDTMRIEERASPELAPGSYVAVATLHSSNYPVQERMAFQMR